MSTSPKIIKILLGIQKCHSFLLQEYSHHVKGSTAVLSVSLWPKEAVALEGCMFILSSLSRIQVGFQFRQRWKISSWKILSSILTGHIYCLQEHSGVLFCKHFLMLDGKHLEFHLWVSQWRARVILSFLSSRLSYT